MVIVLTGSSGFVGKNLLSFLKDQAHTIIPFSLRNKKATDVLQISADAVVHLSGKAHDTRNVADSKEFYTVNTEQTIELFDVFLQSEIKDFFFFSSVKAAADSIEGILDEDITPNPLTHYGISKWKAEKHLLQSPLPNGKRLFIIRPCMIHGPGNKGNLNLLYNIVKKGLPWPLASFHNEKSFLGIDNLNYLIHQMLLKKDLKSGIYNFADDEVLSTNELIVTVNKVLGKKVKLWKISKQLIEKTAALGDKLGLPLNSERLKKLTESFIVSNDKIKRALGIKKLPLSAEEGLIKTINSFKNSTP